jgi:Putative Flp pilus-assembly TadE/G-like
VSTRGKSNRKAESDTGSVIPLVLGFWLVAMLFVAGALATSDVFTKQRALQSVCDSAALAAANNISTVDLRGAAGSSTADAIPLGPAESLVRAYLDRDPARSRVTAITRISGDGVTVQVDCHVHNGVIFGAVILRAGGVDQVAYASARSPLLP